MLELVELVWVDPLPLAMQTAGLTLAAWAAMARVALVLTMGATFLPAGAPLLSARCAWRQITMHVLDYLC